VLCSGTGRSTNSTTLAQLGSCTIPAGRLQAGDRVDIRFSYAHQGSLTAAAFDLRWGSTTILARTASASDSHIEGQAEAGVHSDGAQWSVLSWGNSLPLSAGTGDAADSLGTALVVDFRGRMTTGTSETIALRNFTVVRYPAQINR